MNWNEINGWFTHPDILDAAVERAEDGAVFVEVGCWLGRSTAYFGKKIKESGKKITLCAVDWGFGSPGGKDYFLHEPISELYGGNVAGRFVRNLKECGVLDFVTPIIATSEQASKLFADGSVDFVFIDAAHDMDSVTKDLNLWWSKIKPGGVLSGHDYDGCWLEVVESVNRFFGVPTPPPGIPHSFEFEDKHSKGCWSRTKPSIAVAE